MPAKKKPKPTQPQQPEQPKQTLLSILPKRGGSSEAVTRGKIGAKVLR